MKVTVMVIQEEREAIAELCDQLMGYRGIRSTRFVVSEGQIKHDNSAQKLISAREATRCSDRHVIASEL